MPKNKGGLGKWFGKGGKGGKTKGGWDRYNTKGEKIGKCGDKKKGEGKPKCLSAEKAAKMTKKERANAVKRKRKSTTGQFSTSNVPGLSKTVVSVAVLKCTFLIFSSSHLLVSRVIYLKVTFK